MVNFSKRADQIVSKINSGNSPDNMTGHFVPRSCVHFYGTRFRENGCFSLPKVKGFGKETVAYRLKSGLITMK